MYVFVCTLYAATFLMFGLFKNKKKKIVNIG